MLKVVIDEPIVNEQQLHEVLMNKLELPSYYGKNLDALWDCLTGYIELPLHLEWRNLDEVKENLGEVGDRLLKLLQDAELEGIGFQFSRR